MIKFNIRGENVEVTDAIRAYVEDKIGKLDKYFNDGHEVTAYVNLKVYSEKRAKVEVTLPAKNVTLIVADFRLFFRVFYSLRLKKTFTLTIGLKNTL